MTTLEYAHKELIKYSKLVFDELCEIALIDRSYGNEFDDEIEINVHSGKGTIYGSNPRAVLIGVYKLFYEMGCRFIRPGINGEKIVKRDKNDCSVNKFYRAENRYRGVCSEGAISEQHVIDMIEWLPKVGMNSYFLQFVDGHLFFEKWYKHKNSSTLKPEQYCVADSIRHYKNAVETIKRCGLIFQAVGHGWTTEPLGYITYGDVASVDEDIRQEDREFFALVNGKRGFFNNTPGNTHLCYSNPKARTILVENIVEYIKEHQEIDILHFWLADGINNHCECDACKKKLPSDWYVSILNLLDERLTKLEIKTKIVFLIYCDLLFAPQEEKLNNPDRFIMMFAPIGRDYFSNCLYEKENINDASIDELPPFEQNKNHHPKTCAQYLNALFKWQNIVKCDSFVFDYHLMMFQYSKEPSFLRISRVLYEEMATVKRVGLNGSVSCQCQRIFLPTSLPNYIMAERLFGSVRTFEEIEKECLECSFGEKWNIVKDFLHCTEKFYSSHFMRDVNLLNEGVDKIEEYQTQLKSVKELLTIDSEDKLIKKSVDNLLYFINLQELFVVVLKNRATNKEYNKKIDELFAFIDKNEMLVHSEEDSFFRKEGIKEFLGETT